MYLLSLPERSRENKTGSKKCPPQKGTAHGVVTEARTVPFNLRTVGAWSDHSTRVGGRPIRPPTPTPTPEISESYRCIFKTQTAYVKWVHELKDCYAKSHFQVTDDVTGQVKVKMLRNFRISGMTAFYRWQLHTLSMNQHYVNIQHPSASFWAFSDLGSGQGHPRSRGQFCDLGHLASWYMFLGCFIVLSSKNDLRTTFGACKNE